MNLDDLFKRATSAYLRRCAFPSISKQPSAGLSGFETIGNQYVYVLRNSASELPLIAFYIHPNGRIGKRVELGLNPATIVPLEDSNERWLDDVVDL
jgi:hypothetical protein